LVFKNQRCWQMCPHFYQYNTTAPWAGIVLSRRIL